MDWAQGQGTSSTEQGSKAWHEWRGKGLGSSDAAALLGWSPWKNIIELWEEKTGRSQPLFSSQQLSAMDRGKKLEPEIRRWFEKETGAPYPDGIAEHPEHKFMRASFDGRNIGHDRVLEIKAPNAKDHATALSNEVPEKYVPQCHWLMKVGGHKFCSYVSYGSDGTYAVVNIEADEVIQEELTRRALLFWECIEKDQMPEPENFKKWKRPLSKAVEIPEELKFDAAIEAQEIEAHVAAALELQKIIAKEEARLEAIKVNLKTILISRGIEKLEVGEASFGYMTRKGSVDYSLIPELKTVNLELYRKPETKAFFIKRKSEK